MNLPPAAAWYDLRDLNGISRLISSHVLQRGSRRGGRRPPGRVLPADPMRGPAGPNYPKLPL